MSPEIVTLWQQGAPLFENFASSDEAQRPEHKRRLERWLSNMQLMLTPYPCFKCQGVTKDVVTEDGMTLRCMECGWEPVEVIG